MGQLNSSNLTSIKHSQDAPSNSTHSELLTHTQTSDSMSKYSGPIFSSTFLHTSDFLLTGGSDGVLLLYVLKDKRISQLNGHTNDITTLAYNPENGMTASGSRDEFICLWNYRDIADDYSKNRGYPINKLHGHELTVTGLTINEINLFSGSRDNTVCLWDIESSACINRCSIPRNLVTCVKWIPKEESVLQSSEDKHLRIWDTRVMDVVQNLLHPQCILTACEVSQDGQYFYTSSRGPVENSATATCWDRRTGKILREYPHFSDNLNTCVLWNHLDVLVTASNGGILYFWDLLKCDLLLEKKIYSGPIYSISIHEDRILCSTHSKGMYLFSSKSSNEKAADSSPIFDLKLLGNIHDYVSAL